MASVSAEKLWYKGSPDTSILQRTVPGIFVLALILLSFLSCGTDPEPIPRDLLDQLRALPGVTVTEIAPPQGAFHGRAGERQVTQPIDHNRPSQGTFQQRIFLCHAGSDKPLVLQTEGYGLSRAYVNELTQILSANQIQVTHRYFANARPDPPDWQYLTIAQAAADHHLIVGLFKTLYPKSWVTTGGSKGGMTAMYHMRFYPGDVQASIPYVAPLMLGTEDPRFRTFLFEQVGTEEGRSRIRNFQRHLLQRKNEFLPLAIQAAETRNRTYPLGVEASFEYAVLEYMFAFWQYGDGDTQRIPVANAPNLEMWAALTEVSSPLDYSDTNLSFFEPFWYQAFTELGYYPCFADHLAGWMTAVPSPTYRTFAPPGVTMNFNPQAMLDIREWLAQAGHHMIYVYGALDPYTATAVDDPPAGIDALKFVIPGANHGASLKKLSKDQIAIFCATLGRWMGIEIDPSVIASISPQTPAWLPPQRWSCMSRPTQ